MPRTGREIARAELPLVVPTEDKSPGGLDSIERSPSAHSHLRHDCRAEAEGAHREHLRRGCDWRERLRRRVPGRRVANADSFWSEGEPLRWAGPGQRQRTQRQSKKPHASQRTSGGRKDRLSDAGEIARPSREDADESAANRGRRLRARSRAARETTLAQARFRDIRALIAPLSQSLPIGLRRRRYGHRVETDRSPDSGCR